MIDGRTQNVAKWRSSEREAALRVSESPIVSRATPSGKLRVAPAPVRPKRPRSHWWIAGVVLAAAVGLVLHFRIANRPPVWTTGVPTAEVRSGVIEKTVRLTGSMVAETGVLLRAPYLRGRRSRGASDFGLVLQELVPTGTWVRPNDPVARFDSVYMMNRLDDNRADRLDQELNLRTLLAGHEVKRAAYRQQVRAAKARMDKAALDLKTAPVRSAIQVAHFQLAYEEAKVQYDALLAEAGYRETAETAERRMTELGLDEARVEERRAEVNVGKLVSRAPVAGVVVVRETYRGSGFEAIRAGDELRPGWPFAEIADTRSLIVEARANQVDVGRLRIGSRALVRLDAYPEVELPARVHAIGPIAKGLRWRSTYAAEVPVFLKLDEMDSRMIPNLTVSADVTYRHEEADRIVPREAIFEESDEACVYVQTPSGWEKREVELGVSNNVDIAVESGVSPGDVIALSDPST